MTEAAGTFEAAPEGLRFGDVAIRLGLADAAAVSRALERQREVRSTGAKAKVLGEVMVELGLLEAARVQEVVTEQRRAVAEHMRRRHPGLAIHRDAARRHRRVGARTVGVGLAAAAYWNLVMPLLHMRVASPQGAIPSPVDPLVLILMVLGAAESLLALWAVVGPASAPMRLAATVLLVTGGAATVYSLVGGYPFDGGGLLGLVFGVAQLALVAMAAASAAPRQD
ncbi:MAG: hypothetical protein HY722_03345 [Planctomycetes bacterium]|nr:hypothetical protein [Planctomycetota bacterium]